MIEFGVTIILATVSLYKALGGQTLWWLMIGLAIGGLLECRKHWNDVSKPPRFKMQWWYRHMEYMIVTGIAFFVFGGARFFGGLVTGNFALVLWLAPTSP